MHVVSIKVRKIGSGKLRGRRVDRSSLLGQDLPLFRPDISPVGVDPASVMRCCRSLLPVVGCCCCCHRCCQPRWRGGLLWMRAGCAPPSGTFRPGRGPCAPPLPPSDWLLPPYSPEERCQGLIRVYVDQALSPVFVALRSDRPLMPYRRRITIRRQSGGGPLQFPRSSGPGGHPLVHTSSACMGGTWYVERSPGIEAADCG